MGVVMIYYWVWVLVKWVCSFYEYSLTSTLVIYALCLIFQVGFQQIVPSRKNTVLKK